MAFVFGFCFNADAMQQKIKPSIFLQFPEDGSLESYHLAEQSPIFSTHIDAQVIEHLKTFGYSIKNARYLVQECARLKSLLDSGDFVSQLGTTDPHVLAIGMWKAHQTSERLRNRKQNCLPYIALLSAAVKKELSLKAPPSLLNEGIKTLAELIEGNPYFTKLDLFQAGVDDDGIMILAGLFHIKTLFLEENRITDNGIACLVHHPSLVTLRLWRNHIGSHGATLLAQNTTLQDLGLFANPVGDEGAMALATNATLRALDLRRAGIGDQGAQAFLPNTTLRVLNLRDNTIGDTGIEGFIEKRSLTHLEISKNRITPDKVFILEQMMSSNGYLLELTRSFGSDKDNHLLPPKKRIRILSIDGGGIRGVLPAMIIDRLEERLSRVHGIKPFHIAKHVDLLAGTSTGGLIALGLTMPGEKGNPKYTGQTLANLYKTKGREIFPVKWNYFKPWTLLQPLANAAYDPSGLKRVLDEYFGNIRISELHSNLLITSFDLETHQAHIFDSLLAKSDRSKDFEVRSVCLATTAAPTYFPAAIVKNAEGKEFTLVDGGIYANNPVLLALKRAKKLYPTAEEYIIISIGTGEAEKKDHRYLANRGLVKWGLEVTDVLMNNSTEYTQKLIQDELENDKRMTYLRFQPTLHDDQMKMDNVSPANLENLEKATNLFFESEEGMSLLSLLEREFARDFINDEMPDLQIDTQNSSSQ